MDGGKAGGKEGGRETDSDGEDVPVKMEVQWVDGHACEGGDRVGLSSRAHPHARPVHRANVRPCCPRSQGSPFEELPSRPSVFEAWVCSEPVLQSLRGQTPAASQGEREHGQPGGVRNQLCHTFAACGPLLRVPQGCALPAGELLPGDAPLLSTWLGGTLAEGSRQRQPRGPLDGQRGPEWTALRGEWRVGWAVPGEQPATQP